MIYPQDLDSWHAQIAEPVLDPDREIVDPHHHLCVPECVRRYGADVLLVPKASGLDALVWVLPAVALVCGLAGLAVAFRRWKLQAASVSAPTDADRRLVDEALRAEAER